jgi:DNA-binding response OmpR family regulator
MLTARDSESDKVLGLESGADDYLTKPFGIRELLARVGAITRRYGREDDRAASTKGRTSAAHVQLDPERREALVRGTRVELTRQEFDLLYQLAKRPGIVYSRAALLQNVWSDDTYVTERTVDTVISRPRRKIERDPQDPELTASPRKWRRSGAAPRPATARRSRWGLQFSSGCFHPTGHRGTETQS